MAVTDPGPRTSYSDPVYDRLEICVRFLGRYWLVFVMLVVATIAAIILVRRLLESNPAAASHVAYVRAGQSEKDLAALLDRDDIIPEYKARTANLLVDLRLDAKAYPEARTFAQRGLAFAQEAGHPRLAAIHQINLATVDFETGDYDTARAGYEQVMKLSSLRVESFQATLLRACTLLAQAAIQDEEEQADAALALRKDAVEDLRYCSELTIPGTEAIAEQARFILLELEFRHPALKSTAPPAATPPADAAPATPPVDASPATPPADAAPAPAQP
jgi:tetratricopeptide (TPR) repeat protein